MPLVQALAKAFQSKQPGFVAEFGKGLNSNERLQALENRTIDIALASHGLDTNALAKGGMEVVEIARSSGGVCRNCAAQTQKRPRRNRS